MHRFWDIWLVSIPWPWNPGWGSLKVMENYTIRSGTHDFLLTFHSNHRPISHRFRDKRRYPSKSTRKSPIPPPRVFNAPAEGGSPWNFVSAQGSQETRVMGLSDGRKSFRIGLAVLIQYRSVTASHVAVAITLYAIASSLKIYQNTKKRQHWYLKRFIRLKLHWLMNPKSKS